VSGLFPLGVVSRFLFITEKLKQKKQSLHPFLERIRVQPVSGVYNNHALGTGFARSMIDSPLGWAAGWSHPIHRNLGRERSGCTSILRSMRFTVGVVTQGRKDCRCQWVTSYTESRCSCPARTSQCAMKRDPPRSRATLAKSTPTCTARTAFQQLCVDDAFREVFPPLLAQPHDNASRASDLTLPNWSA
jgi:hypothetical protein